MRTDMTKLVDGFHIVANANKKLITYAALKKLSDCFRNNFNFQNRTKIGTNRQTLRKGMKCFQVWRRYRWETRIVKPAE
jgi:hypothetical protein